MAHKMTNFKESSLLLLRNDSHKNTQFPNQYFKNLLYKLNHNYDKPNIYGLKINFIFTNCNGINCTKDK